MGGLIHGLVGGRAIAPVPLSLTPNGNLMNDRPIGSLIATQTSAPSGNDHRIAWRLNKNVAWIRDNDLDPAESSLSGKFVVTGAYLSEAGQVFQPWADKIPVNTQEASVRVRFPGEDPIYFQIRANMGAFPLYGVELIELGFSNGRNEGIVLLGYKSRS